jgi:hypothetical protein
MKPLLFIFFSFFNIVFAKAQDDYGYVDNIMLGIPASATESTSSIAAFIQSNFKKEKEKFRAIHRWVSYNIKYDTDSMYVFNWGADPGKKVMAALRRRKGVCENFTAVFNEIALKCKLQSFVVSGYTKQSGRVDNVGHSWCAVNADGEWLFCDPTWDENYTSTPNYFLISPAFFIESHMPFDPLWQLLDHPVARQIFYDGNFHLQKDMPDFHFADSVKAFLQLNELQRLEAAIGRIQHFGLVNELEKNNLSFLEMQASLIYEDRDVSLYNSAVNDINKATVILNHFIEYRNRQFSPEKPDNELNTVLTPAFLDLKAAQEKLEQLGHSTANAQYDTYAATERLKNLREKLNEQQEFLSRYLASSLSERKKLFYN